MKQDNNGTNREDGFRELIMILGLLG